MKPVVTWVVLANARTAQVYAHHGPGKGLTPLSGQSWSAPETRLPDDKAGRGHSIGGPGVAAVEQTDPQNLNDALFAKTVIEHVAKAQRDKRFDRLILVAGPHMLGLLRANVDPALQAVHLGDVPKDLSHQPLNVVESNLGELIAV